MNYTVEYMPGRNLFYQILVSGEIHGTVSVGTIFWDS